MKRSCFASSLFLLVLNACSPSQPIRSCGEVNIDFVNTKRLEALPQFYIPSLTLRPPTYQLDLALGTIEFPIVSNNSEYKIDFQSWSGCLRLNQVITTELNREYCSDKTHTYRLSFYEDGQTRHCSEAICAGDAGSKEFSNLLNVVHQDSQMVSANDSENVYPIGYIQRIDGGNYSIQLSAEKGTDNYDGVFEISQGNELLLRLRTPVGEKVNDSWIPCRQRNGAELIMLGLAELAG